jgi:hypothetical protein
MLIDFKDESHYPEWKQVFEDKLNKYAECYEYVQQRVFGNAHLAIAAGEMYDCVRHITDELCYDTNTTIRNRYAELYKDRDGDYTVFMSDKELNKKIDERLSDINSSKIEFDTFNEAPN